MNPVIFDFNGTMFLDTDKNEAAWRQLVKECTGYELTEEDFKACIHGSPNPVIVQKFINPGLTVKQAMELSQRKEIIYRRLCLEDKEGLRLTPGLTDYLDYLVEQKIPHNIATGADRGNLDFYLEHLDLGKWFEPEKIVFSDGSFKGKPAPDIYLMAAERLEVPIESCIVYEDAYLGVVSAKAAGVKKIIGLCAIPESKFLYDLPQVDRVIKDFTNWQQLKL